MSSINIRKIGITDLDTDAIVNAANNGLLEGGGVCGAIFRAAGRTDLKSACDRIGYCDTGSAVITPGFRLKAKYIIHAVGPVWSGGTRKEGELLYGAYWRALELAVENGCRSIGFPLISAGIFGYPVDQAWRKALQACSEFLAEGHQIDIVFAVLEDRILNKGNRTLKELAGQYSGKENGKKGSEKGFEKEPEKDSEEDSEDTLILVDLDDREIGTISKLSVHKLGYLHRAFSVFLFQGDRLLIQRRAIGKYHSAGLYANTCCSHPRVGESLLEAAAKRLQLECGIEKVTLHEAGHFVYRAVFSNGLTEYEMDHVLVGEYAGPMKANPEEVAELFYVPIDELKKEMLINPECYAAWFFTALGIALECKKLWG